MNAAMSEGDGPGLPPGLGRTFEETLALLDGLSLAVNRLDEELLTGQPHTIAEAAAELETSLAESHPGFEKFRLALVATGDGRLGTAAQRLHQGPQPALGIQLDQIRMGMLRLARRSGAGLKRAESLGNGLASSLQALRALDVVGRDQLLAEA